VGLSFRYSIASIELANCGVFGPSFFLTSSPS